jgi:uncharacterized SAM-binding protein YcdF (DUF218 family)
MNESLSLTYLAGGVVVPPVSLVLLALLGLWIARRRRAIGGAIAAGALAALFALSLPVVAFALMTHLEGPATPDPRAAAREAGAIVILGGGVARGAVEWGGDTVGVFTLQRLRYGAHLAKALGLPVLITGAASADGRPGEAAMMRDVLEREFGVDVRWFDERARTTAGNAREAAALLRDAGVSRVVLVTHAFHMARARAAFERAGMQVVPAPTGYMGYADGAFEAIHLVPNGDALRVSYVALREMAARLLYRVVDRQ